LTEKNAVAKMLGSKGKRKYTVVLKKEKEKRLVPPPVTLMLTVLPQPVPHYRPDE
jgi:hypothetical protein